VIRKYYYRSIVALLLIPVVVIIAAQIFAAINPELAAGHANYARNYALLDHARRVALLGGPVLAGVLWLLSGFWLLRAKLRRGAWLWLAVLGAPGFALLSALLDRSPPAPNDAYRRQLARLPLVLRILYEVVRFAALTFVTMQLIEWWNDGTALFEATRRGVALAVVLAERDASSGMWAFGDAMRAGFLFVLIYALWPAGYNTMAGLIRRLRRRTVSHSPPGA
jgi:hypothetical protein